jgi:hypothetical protein
MTGIDSINEPGQRTAMVLPVSINEGPSLPEGAGVPVIASLDPSSVAIGDPDTTLFVTGEQFYPGSIINFAGHDEPTTLNEDGTLSTGLKPSLWGSPVVVQCFVRNGSVLSNGVDFTFGEPAGARKRAHAAHVVDPDELEDELEEAEEDGDFKPTHKAHKSAPKRKR